MKDSSYFQKAFEETQTVIFEIKNGDFTPNFDLPTIRPQNDGRNFTIIFDVQSSWPITVKFEGAYLEDGEREQHTEQIKSGVKRAFTNEYGYWREIEITGG